MPLAQFFRDTFNPSHELRELRRICSEVHRRPYKKYGGWDLRELQPREAGNCAAMAYTAYLACKKSGPLLTATYALVVVETWRGIAHTQLKVETSRNTWYVDPTYNTVARSPMSQVYGLLGEETWPVLKAAFERKGPAHVD